jgi:hypothetical protein
MIVGWNGMSEAQVMPTGYVQKEFSYDDAYNDAIDYAYDSLERSPYEL